MRTPANITLPNPLNLKSFVTFTCCGQSGHTIIAACLDAHPNAMIGEELKVISRRWPMEKVYQRCFEDSRDRVASTKCLRNVIGTIPNQYQGTYKDNLYVLGDKCGWDVIGKRLDKGVFMKDLNRFKSIIAPTKHKVIHAIRNPFDIISNWNASKSSRKHLNHQGPKNLINAINHYEKYAKIIFDTYYESGNFSNENLIQIRNEDFGLHPKESLARLAEFLDLDIDGKWIESCVKVIKLPNRRVTEVEWPEVMKHKVYYMIDKYFFLRGYEF